MHHVMFDIDGTLVQSVEFDGTCYFEAVYEVLGHRLDTNWGNYTFVSDAGILDQHIREHGLIAKRDEIHAAVREVFIFKIASQVKNAPVQEVSGAAALLAELRRQGDISVSIATGGWLETALIKLESAGIDVSGIPIASSNDHYSRVKIMKIAAARAAIAKGVSCTYFGDGEWDKQACEELGYSFVLVGEKSFHDPCILDFSNIDRVLAFIGV